MDEAHVFGVVTGTADAPRVAYLKRSAEVTADVVAGLGDLDPTSVFRYSARCEEHRCGQFDGHRCTLAQRIVEGLEAVVAELPSCQIRRSCRWYAEAGSEACLRCPQVVTRVPSDQNALRSAALPG
jgi:hypothetical protein